MRLLIFLAVLVLCLSARLPRSLGHTGRPLEQNAGDDIMLPAIVSIRRDGESGYSIRATVPFEFTDARRKTVRVTAARLSGKQPGKID